VPNVRRLGRQRAGVLPGAPLPLGTLTKWGPIVAVQQYEHERYYWMSKGRGDISMMPAVLVEASCAS
jgi:hypothetical protein